MNYEKYPQAYAKVWIGAIHRGSGGFGGFDETIQSNSLEKLNKKIQKLTYHNNDSETYGIAVYEMLICPVNLRWSDTKTCCNHKPHLACPNKDLLNVTYLGKWQFTGAGNMCLTWVPVENTNTK